MSGFADPVAADSHLRLRLVDAEARRLSTSLSAIEHIDHSLWIAGDESTSLVRLTLDRQGDYGDQKSFALGDFFPALRRKVKQEMDLEALSWDADESRLWFVGSHSLRRKDREALDSAASDEALTALGKIDRQQNRYVLGSVVLQDAADGSGRTPVSGSATAVPFDEESSSLVSLLKSDAGFAPFMDIPSKENGFDIEGLAVAPSRLFLGLRGPVMRGLAGVLQFRVANGKDVVLKADGGTKPWRHCLLDLGGLGVRDLCVQDKDLLVLAGPTMKLDGPVRLYRWKGALDGDASGLVDGNALQPLFNIAFGEGSDHAEGIALLKTGEGKRLIVVYDSPSPARLNGGDHYTADVFDLR